MQILLFTNSLKPLVKCDPRIKLVIMICISMIGFKLLPFWLEAAIICFVCFTLALSRVYTSAVIFLLTFIGMYLCDIYIAVHMTETLWIAVFGLMRMMRRYLPFMACFYLLAKTVTVGELMVTFHKFKLPMKIIIPLTLVFRFIPTIAEEWTAITESMKFRGIGLSVKNVLTKPLKMFEYVFVPLLISVSNIAEELGMASIARGLDGDNKRTYVRDMSLSSSDLVFIIPLVLIIAEVLLFSIGQTGIMGPLIGKISGIAGGWFP